MATISTDLIDYFAEMDHVECILAFPRSQGYVDVDWSAIADRIADK